MKFFSKIWAGVKKAFTKNDNSKKAESTQQGSKKQNKAVNGSIVVDSSHSETTNNSQNIGEQNIYYSNANNNTQEIKLNELEKQIFEKIYADGCSGNEVQLNDICENEHFFADALRTLSLKDLIINLSLKQIVPPANSQKINFIAKLTTRGLFYGQELEKAKKRAEEWRNNPLPFIRPKIK